MSSSPVNPELRSPLTVQKINGMLRRAALPQSKSSTTAVRGWHDVTHGFSSWKDNDSADILVAWRTPPMYRATPAYLFKQLTVVADVLRKEGLQVDFAQSADYVRVRYTNG